MCLCARLEGWHTVPSLNYSAKSSRVIKHSDSLSIQQLCRPEVVLQTSASEHIWARGCDSDLTTLRISWNQRRCRKTNWQKFVFQLKRNFRWNSYGNFPQISRFSNLFQNVRSHLAVDWLNLNELLLYFPSRNVHPNTPTEVLPVNQSCLGVLLLWTVYIIMNGIEDTNTYALRMRENGLPVWCTMDGFSFLYLRSPQVAFRMTVMVMVRQAVLALPPCNLRGRIKPRGLFNYLPSLCPPLWLNQAATNRVQFHLTLSIMKSLFPIKYHLYIISHIVTFFSHINAKSWLQVYRKSLTTLHVALISRMYVSFYWVYW